MPDEKRPDLYHSVISTLHHASRKFWSFQEARDRSGAGAYLDDASLEIRSEGWRLLYQAFEAMAAYQPYLSPEFRALVVQAQDRIDGLGFNPLPPERDDLVYTILPGLLMELTIQAELELGEPNSGQDHQRRQ